jgi:hypothetical protein
LVVLSLVWICMLMLDLVWSSFCAIGMTV